MSFCAQTTFFSPWKSQHALTVDSGASWHGGHAGPGIKSGPTQAAQPPSLSRQPELPPLASSRTVVMLGGYQQYEVDFGADDPGLTFFHCHQQLHMDFGVMTLFDYL
jgi:hypothetical protein